MMPLRAAPSVTAPEPIRINPDGTAWMEQARCVGEDPELWATADNGARVRLGTDRPDHLTDKGRDNLRALMLCNVCPVQPECLAYALDQQIDHGIWGGTFPHDREGMRHAL